MLESVEEIYDKIYGYDVAKRIAKREASARSSLEHQSDAGSLFD